MPLLKLLVSTPVDPAKKASLLPGLSKLVSESLGKPEKYVMVAFEDDAAILMAGAAGPAAFADVKGIGGFGDKANKVLSSKLCAFLKENLGIQSDRVYINFTDVDAVNWGWNSGTFG